MKSLIVSHPHYTKQDLYNDLNGCIQDDWYVALTSHLEDPLFASFGGLINEVWVQS